VVGIVFGLAMLGDFFNEVLKSLNFSLVASLPKILSVGMRGTPVIL
jgi:hypothetical protein